MAGPHYTTSGVDAMESALTGTVRGLIRRAGLGRDAISNETVDEFEASIAVNVSMEERVDEGTLEVDINIGIYDLPPFRIRQRLLMSTVRSFKRNARDLLHEVARQAAHAIDHDMETPLQLRMIGHTRERRNQQSN